MNLASVTEETFIRHVEWLPVVDSTNTRALADASGRNADRLPLLIGATRQLAGRGRGGNRWWDGGGGLMFSVLFDMPQLQIAQSMWPLFSLTTGLSVAETLEVFAPDCAVRLKWPNDVWINGLKVCGILIEQPDAAPGRLVAGIGLNVNGTFATAPDDLGAIATSLHQAAGHTFAVEEILVRLLQRWEVNIRSLAAGELNLIERWKRFCALRDRPVSLTCGDTHRTGVCRGLNEQGALLLEVEGITTCHHAGTVRLLVDPADETGR